MNRDACLGSDSPLPAGHRLVASTTDEIRRRERGFGRSTSRAPRNGKILAMDVAPEITPRPGKPRSDADAVVVQRFDRVMRIPIILAAVLPIIIVPESGNWWAALVGIVSWLVFLVDYMVNERRLVSYTSTWLGRFDLAVVVLTAPWFLLPGASGGSFVVILRLARLARV